MLFPIFVPVGKSKTRYKVGYIARDGRLAIDPIFEEGTRFNEGMAAVKVKGGRWGIINADGSFVIPPALSNRCQFQDGLAGIATRTGKWGVIDLTGNFLVEPKYTLIRPYRQQLALVRVGNWEKSRWGFIDRRGHEVIPARFHRANDFSEGLAAVKVAHLWGYILPSGLFQIHPRFESSGDAIRWPDTRAGRFVNGLAPVWAGQNFYRFIDPTGSFAFDGAFEDANSFSEGRAVVKLGDLYGFIDTNGQMAIECRFAVAYDFSEGLARIEEKDSRTGFSRLSGFIDLDGKQVIRPAFSTAESFRGGLSLVSKDGTIGYINTSGEFVWQGAHVDFGVVC